MPTNTRYFEVILEILKISSMVEMLKILEVLKIHEILKIYEMVTVNILHILWVMKKRNMAEECLRANREG